MKKLLILLLFFVCSLLTYSQIQTINVGTVANDGTGDPLRQAFIKVNNNFSYHSGLIVLKANLASPTFTGTVILPATTIIAGNTVPGIVGDTITDRMDKAIPLNDIAPLWVDTLTYIATKSDLLNIEGGGGTAKIYKLQFRTDTTAGAPNTGDSILVHNNFIGKHLEVYRGPAAHATESGANLQLQNTTGVPNVADGFRFNSTTGEIIFRPVFATNEMVVVESTNTITWEDLSIEGEESSLLTGLIAGWQFDETSGTNFSNVLGSNNATTYGTVLNQPGKFGVSFRNNHRSDYTVVANHSSLWPEDELTISMWFKLDSLPSVTGRNMFLIRHYDNDHVWSYEAFIKTSENYITWYIWNEAGASFQTETDEDAIVINTWYNLILELDVGAEPKIYLNNVDVSYYNDGGNFTGTVNVPSDPLYIGNANYDGTSATMGYIDATFIWHRILTSGEKITLQTKTHPF